MKTLGSISVIIPAYDEAGSIGGVIDRIKEVDDSFEIIVVDDGSHDDTARVAHQHGAKVLRHPYNLGNGSAVKSGAVAASGEYLVFIDGDGQHPPEEIPSLCGHAAQYDMVVGARTGESRTSLVRNIGNWGLKTLAQWITKNRIDDLTSGFRLMKRSRFLEFYYLYPPAYSYPTTVTVAMLMSGYFVKYVPLDSITRRGVGASNISPVADGLRFINIILRIIMTFAPQRIFTPVSMALIGLGVVASIGQLIYTSGIQSASVILLMTGVLVFLFGLTAEQISLIRRKPDLEFLKQVEEGTSRLFEKHDYEE